MHKSVVVIERNATEKDKEAQYRAKSNKKMTQQKMAGGKEEGGSGWMDHKTGEEAKKRKESKGGEEGNGQGKKYNVKNLKEFGKM